jgi:hypothetical protein
MYPDPQKILVNDATMNNYFGSYIESETVSGISTQTLMEAAIINQRFIDPVRLGSFYMNTVSP